MLRIFASAAAFALLLAAPSQAAIITYTSSANWQTAVSNVQTDTFSNLNGQIITNGTGVLRASGVQFIGSATPNAGFAYRTQVNNISGTRYISGPDYFTATDDQLLVKLPTNTYALGFTLSTLDSLYTATGGTAPASATITVTAGVETFTITGVPFLTNSVWFGLTSDAALSSILLKSNSTAPAISTFSLASYTPVVGGGGPVEPVGGTVPEPTSLALCGGAILLLAKFSKFSKFKRA